MELVKIAWRNLWRSKSRTILTAFVVFFVVILSIMSTSQQEGMYENLIDNVVEFSGHIQVQDTNYVKNKTINDAIVFDDELQQKIESIENVTQAAPRMESFSLASYGDKTKGVMVMGIDPIKEMTLSRFETKLVRFRLDIDSTEFEPDVYKKLKPINRTSFSSEESFKKRLERVVGEEDLPKVWDKLQEESRVSSVYLENGDKGTLIGEALADYLEIELGDTLVMISQGYHGASAADLFVVKGFVKLPLIMLERRLVVLDIIAAQQFYSAEGMVTSVLVQVDKNRDMLSANVALNESLPEKMMSQTWRELQPETVQMIDSDRAGGVFMKGIFYMIVGFIIFGTIMMMLQERKREFGVLIAVGLQRGKLALILLYETLMISLLGTILGFLISIPITYTMHKNPIPLQGEMAEMMLEYGFEPIIYFSAAPQIFYHQAIIIFVVSIVIFLFPLSRLGKLNVIKSIRG